MFYFMTFFVSAQWTLFLTTIISFIAYRHKITIFIALPSAASAKENTGKYNKTYL
jgi:hypothetical protein